MAEVLAYLHVQVSVAELGPSSHVLGKNTDTTIVGGRGWGDTTPCIVKGRVQVRFGFLGKFVLIIVMVFGTVSKNFWSLR